MALRFWTLVIMLLASATASGPIFGQSPAANPEPATSESAQPANPTWSINTAVRTGEPERVTCTLTFPAAGDLPRLSVNVIGQRSPLPSLGFNLRGVGPLASTERAIVPDVSLLIGRSIDQKRLEGQWRSASGGTITFTSEGNASLIINAVARASEMTVVIGDNTYQYDLTGSLRAIFEFNKCLV